MEKSPFKKHSNTDPFREPHHELPNQFRTNQEEGNQDPFTEKNFARDLLVGPERVEVNKSVVPQHFQKKSIFGKPGIRRSKVRKEFAEASHFRGPKKAERIEEESKMDKKKYGEMISDKDMWKYIKDLKKEESHAPYREQLEKKHRRSWLEWLMGKK